MLDLTKLATETRNPETTDLDKMSPLEIATAMNREDARAVASIEPELSKIAQAIDWGTGRAAAWVFLMPPSARRHSAFHPTAWSV